MDRILKVANVVDARVTIGRQHRPLAFLILLLIVLSILCVDVHAEDTRRLSYDQLVSFLKNEPGKSDQKLIMSIVRERGLDFALTDERIRELKKLGANDELLSTCDEHSNPEELYFLEPGKFGDLCIKRLTFKREVPVADDGLTPEVKAIQLKGQISWDEVFEKNIRPRAVITVKVTCRDTPVHRVEGVLRKNRNIKFRFRDDGVPPDNRCGDGIWSLQIDGPFGDPPTECDLEIVAYDKKGGCLSECCIGKVTISYPSADDRGAARWPTFRLEREPKFEGRRPVRFKLDEMPYVHGKTRTKKFAYTDKNVKAGEAYKYKLVALDAKNRVITQKEATDVSEDGIHQLFRSLRVGYESVEFDDTSSGVWYSLFCYGRMERSRERWEKVVPRAEDGPIDRRSLSYLTLKLIPDYYLEISHSKIPFSDEERKGKLNDGETQDDGEAEHEAQDEVQGIERGARLRTGLYWPWGEWKTSAPKFVEGFREPSDGKLKISVGPTIWGGVEKEFHNMKVGEKEYYEHDLLYHYYGGIRMANTPESFLELTVGESKALEGTRLQLLFEAPLFAVEKPKARVYLRTLWNWSITESDDEDLLTFTVLAQIPFSEAARIPRALLDSLPFVGGSEATEGS